MRVVLEVAPRKAFATAIDWPGWSRSGRTDADALQRLLDYAPRYARVARRAKVPFDPPASIDGFEVVERLSGGGGTEFGVPGEAASAEDGDAVDDGDLERLEALLRAAWATFDAAASSAQGIELATGPRGGGRDVDKIVEHVREAEVAYLGQLGSKPPASADDLRDAFLETLRARVRGTPIANPRNTRKPWSPRYAVRRSAWHSLDHAWEIEDRS
ncbi:MAG: hypothetical protein M3Y29_04775 [Chloroflexota bacterium]|nr:hypothetical protein [Chloroflexota bacterium]